MKYTIEFELPDNDTILKNIKTDYVYWRVWGYSGCCHAQPTVAWWIPCSERLPKRSVEVLTCDSVGTIEVRSLEVSYDGMLYWENRESEWEHLSDAIAWMPLPEPYKEAEK